MVVAMGSITFWYETQKSIFVVACKLWVHVRSYITLFRYVKGFSLLTTIISHNTIPMCSMRNESLNETISNGFSSSWIKGLKLMLCTAWVLIEIIFQAYLQYIDYSLTFVVPAFIANQLSSNSPWCDEVKPRYRTVLSVLNMISTVPSFACVMDNIFILGSLFNEWRSFGAFQRMIFWPISVWAVSLWKIFMTRALEFKYSSSIWTWKFSTHINK